MNWKRALISFGIAFCLLMVLAFARMLAAAVSGGDLLSPPKWITWPTALPGLTYFAIIPDSIQMRLISTAGAEPILFFFANLVIYSVVIYVLASLVRRKA